MPTSSQKTQRKQTLRDKIRSKTVGSEKVFKEILVEWDGITVAIRQPSIKRRNALNERCVTTVGDKVVVDALEFLAWVVIENTYVPDTNELVFEAADYEDLVQNPTGGFMDIFGEKAAELSHTKGLADKKKSSKAVVKSS